jgi:hypothetical protein
MTCLLASFDIKWKKAIRIMLQTRINPKILIMANNRGTSTDKDKSSVYRILVVDDDADITLSFKTGLE